jgi:hypothetical protein
MKFTLPLCNKTYRNMPLNLLTVIPIRRIRLLVRLLAPLVTCFAKFKISGVTPKYSAPVQVPKRPKPVIYSAFMQQDLPEHAIEFTHGYTYSAHPVACAAALAALDDGGIAITRS